MVTDPKQQGVLEAVKQSMNQSADRRMIGALVHLSFLGSKSLFHLLGKEKRIPESRVERSTDNNLIQSDALFSKIISNVHLRYT